MLAQQQQEQPFHGCGPGWPAKPNKPDNAHYQHSTFQCIAGTSELWRELA